MKNQLSKGQLFAQVPLTANATSQAVDCRFLDNVAFQFNVTSGTTPSGTLQIQASIDHEEQGQQQSLQTATILGMGRVTVPGNWVPLTLSATPTITTAPSFFYVELNQIAASWLRIVYIFTSGTGFADCFVCGKGIS
jgi:hypothetical protein